MAATRHGAGSISGSLIRWCVGSALLLSSVATPAGADAPLRASTTLTLPGTIRAIGDTERALLRLEARAGQSRIDEAATIEDMTARLARMGRTLAELQALIVALPDARCPPAAAPACPAPPAPPAPPVEPPTAATHEPPWGFLAMFAGVAALLAIFWQWQRRRGVAAGFERLSTILADPETSPQSVTQPPAALARPGREIPDDAQPPEPAALAAPTEMLDRAVGSPAAAAVASPIGDADMSLELADVMLAMRLTDGAAQTLEEHIRAHPRQALNHWLKLLDIYRRSGQRDDFEESAVRLQRYFNVAPPDWQPDAAMPAALRPSTIENYPHVSNRIEDLWPRRACAEYLARLLEDNRGGTRTGFPQPVVEEILLLLALLRA
jgi:hypothetical protein